MTVMTRYALRSDGAWACLAPGAVLPRGNRNADGVWEPVQFNVAWADSLPADALVERDLAVIAEGSLQIGEKATTWTLVDVDGAPVRAWESEPRTPEDLAAMRDQCVLAVKAEAGRRILAQYPTWKQANMNMRATELADIRHDRDLTIDEQAERDALLAAATWIKAVRAASDTIEAAIPEDAEGLALFDAASADGWPA